MPYDYQLIGGILLAIFGLVAVANAMVEKRSPLFGLIGMLAGLGLFAWAWILADGSLTAQDVPSAVYRLIASWR